MRRLFALAVVFGLLVQLQQPAIADSGRMNRQSSVKQERPVRIRHSLRLSKRGTAAALGLALITLFGCGAPPPPEPSRAYQASELHNAPVQTMVKLGSTLYFVDGGNIFQQSETASPKYLRTRWNAKSLIGYQNTMVVLNTWGDAYVWSAEHGRWARLKTRIDSMLRSRNELEAILVAGRDVLALNRYGDVLRYTAGPEGIPFVQKKHVVSTGKATGILTRVHVEDGGGFEETGITNVRSIDKNGDGTIVVSFLDGTSRLIQPRP